MNETHGANKGLMVVFWAYVLIPLAWGVTNTVIAASHLFK